MSETDEPDLAYERFLERTKKLRRRELATMDRKENWGNWGLAGILKERKKLMRTSSIMNPEITKIDNWLVTQSLSLRDLIDIWSRANYCLLGMYQDAEPEIKQELLLMIEGAYEEFLKLPIRWQQKLWPMWANWAAVFAVEEEEEEMQEAKHG